MDRYPSHRGLTKRDYLTNPTRVNHSASCSRLRPAGCWAPNHQTRTECWEKLLGVDMKSEGRSGCVGSGYQIDIRLYSNDIMIKLRRTHTDHTVSTIIHIYIYIYINLHTYTHMYIHLFAYTYFCVVFVYDVFWCSERCSASDFFCYRFWSFQGQDEPPGALGSYVCFLDQLGAIP